jgi:hypothetical protein
MMAASTSEATVNLLSHYKADDYKHTYLNTRRHENLKPHKLSGSYIKYQTLPYKNSQCHMRCIFISDGGTFKSGVPTRADVHKKFHENVTSKVITEDNMCQYVYVFTINIKRPFAGIKCNTPRLFDYEATFICPSSTLSAPCFLLYERGT